MRPSKRGSIRPSRAGEAAALLALAVTLAGCAAGAYDYDRRTPPRVFVRHSPLNPDPGELVTFIASADLGTVSLAEITVSATVPGGAVETTCTSDPCTLTATPSGPGVGVYSARARGTSGAPASSAFYAFQVGQPGLWETIALRVPIDLLAGDQVGDVLLVADGDSYPAGPLALRADAESLLYDGLLADPAYRWRDNQLGFWLSAYVGTTSDFDSGMHTRCGQDPWRDSPSAVAAETAALFADILAVIHRSGFRDCAGLGLGAAAGAGSAGQRRLSADGARPEVFQHELGHAFAGLSDEYHESTDSRTARGGPPPANPLACDCCDSSIVEESFCLPGVPSCIGFVAPPDCDPVRPACPLLDGTCPNPNLFASQAECQAAAAAAAVHPGVENPQPATDCRRLCSNIDPVWVDCPCTTDPIERWILDLHHPGATPGDDVMGELDTAAGEQHGPACQRCLETTFCIAWERARGRTESEAEAHCLLPEGGR